MSLSEKQEKHYGSIIDKLDNRFDEKKNKLIVDIDNQRRSKEINKYYSLKYNSYANIFLYASIFAILYLILRYIEMLGIIPSFITTILMLLISTLGILYIIYLRLDVKKRNNYNYNKYDFVVKDSHRNQNTITLSSDLGNLSCSGADCCPYGTTFDIQENICKI
jgi:hypothetical protein